MWTLGDRGSIRVPTRAQEHRVAAVWLIYDGHLIGRQREAAHSKSDEFCADGQAEIDAHLSENRVVEKSAEKTKHYLSPQYG